MGASKNKIEIKKRIINRCNMDATISFSKKIELILLEKNIGKIMEHLGKIVINKKNHLKKSVINILSMNAKIKYTDSYMENIRGINPNQKGRFTANSWKKFRTMTGMGKVRTHKQLFKMAKERGIIDKRLTKENLLLDAFEYWAAQFNTFNQVRKASV